MKALEWFKSLTGKKVVATAESGKHTVTVKNNYHAELLHKSQSSDISYRKPAQYEDDYVTPLLAGVLLAEVIESSPDYSSDAPVPDFGGFGGGSTDGAGAGGSWGDSGTSSVDSSPSYGSGDSSFDSGTSFDSGSSFSSSDNSNW